MNVYDRGTRTIIGAVPEPMQSDPAWMHPMYVWDDNHSAAVFKGEEVSLVGRSSPTKTGADGIMANPLYGIVAMASAGVSAFHGYRRNRGSLGWGVAWGLLGGMFPVLTPAIALAQGFAKPEKK